MPKPSNRRKVRRITPRLGSSQVPGRLTFPNGSFVGVSNPATAPLGATGGGNNTPRSAGTVPPRAPGPQLPPSNPNVPPLIPPPTIPGLSTPAPTTFGTPPPAPVIPSTANLTAPYTTPTPGSTATTNPFQYHNEGVTTNSNTAGSFANYPRNPAAPYTNPTNMLTFAAGQYPTSLSAQEVYTLKLYEADEFHELYEFDSETGDYKLKQGIDPATGQQTEQKVDTYEAYGKNNSQAAYGPQADQWVANREKRQREMAKRDEGKKYKGAGSAQRGRRQQSERKVSEEFVTFSVSTG